MVRNRKVEIFSAGCSVCEKTIQLVTEMACSLSDIEVLDMKDPLIADRAKKMGLHKIPTVFIDGKIADCYARGALNETFLKRAGIGQPISV
jgi:glutaredoxin